MFTLSQDSLYRGLLYQGLSASLSCSKISYLFMQNPSVLEEAEGITKKFDHRSENWMKFDTFSSFWNIIQTPAASAGPAAVGCRVFFTLLL